MTLSLFSMSILLQNEFVIISDALSTVNRTYLNNDSVNVVNDIGFFLNSVQLKKKRFLKFNIFCLLHRIWNKSPANDGQSNCGAINIQGKLADLNCKAEEGYICRYASGKRKNKCSALTF